MKNQSFFLALRYADVIDQTTPELFIEADVCQVPSLLQKELISKRRFSLSAICSSKDSSFFCLR
jgi:hypothetical protein